MTTVQMPPVGTPMVVSCPYCRWRCTVAMPPEPATVTHVCAVAAPDWPNVLRLSWEITSPALEER